MVAERDPGRGRPAEGRSKPDPGRVRVILVAALVAALVTLVMNLPSGPGVSPDSAGYIAGARSLLAGDGYSDAAGRPIDKWPPGMATLLALLALVGVPAVTAGVIVNALCAFLISGLLAAWASEQLSAAPVRWAAIVAGVASPPLLYVESRLWSEPPFIGCLTVALFAAARVADRPDRRWLAVLSVALCGAVWLRYAGLFLLPIGLVAAIQPGVHGRRRLSGVAWALAPAMVVAGAVLARNLVVTGHAAGPRVAGTFGVPAAVDHAMTAIASWFSPWQPAGLRVLTSFAVAGLLGWAMVTVVGLAVATARPGVVPATGLRTARVVAAPALAGTSYLLAMVVTAGRVQMDVIDSRLLAPLWVPLLMVVATLLDVSIERRPRRGVGRLAWWLFVGLGLAPIVVHAVARVVVEGRRVGGEYNQARWRQPQLRTAIEALPPDAVLASNHPEIVQLYSERIAILSAHLPVVGGGPSVRPRFDLDGIAGVQSGRLYLLWFDLPGRPYLAPPEELARWYRLAPCGAADGLRIWRVTAAPSLVD